MLLFESVRELLLNVVKHARAKSARVELLINEHEELLLTVSDNGRGFDVAALQSFDPDCRGFGLFSIRERLELMGGRIEIASACGQGTRVSLIAPMSAVLGKSTP